MARKRERAGMCRTGTPSHGSRDRRVSLGYFDMALRLISLALLATVSSGAAAWDPLQPWLISDPPRFLESKVCSCEVPPPERFARGQDLYYFDDEEQSHQGSCYSATASASSSTVDVINAARATSFDEIIDLNRTCFDGERGGKCACPVRRDLLAVHETALRRVVMSRGDPTRLQRLARKLEKCTGDVGDDPITIAVLGGSETAGHGNTCAHDDTKDILDIPAHLRIPVRGGDYFPWANYYRTLLTKVYPKCRVDMLNLAVGGANSMWGLAHLPHMFSAPNATRSGRPLGEVVDLVVLEYGVNVSLIPLTHSLTQILPPPLPEMRVFA